MSGFRTKVDYGTDNRQLKQLQFSETVLSGKTTFGVDDAYIPENFTGDTINIDALQYIKSRGLIVIDGTQQNAYVLTSDANGKGTWQPSLNTYLSGATFSTSTGDLGLSILSGGTITVNLDGRYALSGTTGGDGTPQTLSYTASTGQLSISSGNTVTTVLPSGLEALNEGNGIGWRLIGSDPAKFGNIGKWAVDMTHITGYYSNTGASGALSTSSISIGADNKVGGGIENIAIGADNTVTTPHHNGLAIGYQNRIFGGNSSMAMGSYNEINAGSNGFGFIAGMNNRISNGVEAAGGGIGLALDIRSRNQVAVGASNTIWGGGQADANRPIFTVGIGTFSTPAGPWAAITRKDGFNVDYAGLVTAPSQTTAMITAEATGRVLVTREYLTGIVASGITQTLSFTGSTGDLEIVGGNTVNLGFTSGEVTNWNTSYNWGDHSTYGYLTGYTDTNDNIYVTGSTFNDTNGILEFTNVSGGTFNVGLDGRYSLTGHTHTISEVTDFPTNISYFTNDVAYLTGYTETPQTLSYTASTGQLSISSGNTVTTVLPSGLEALNEGSGIGWRLIGRDPARYGNIGLKAVDLTTLESRTGTTFGVSSAYGVGMGPDTIVSNGWANTAIGGWNTVSSPDHVCVAIGNANTITSGYGCVAIGIYNEIAADANGFGVLMGMNNRMYGTAPGAGIGLALDVRARNHVAVGASNTIWGGTNDAVNRPIFTVGIGTYSTPAAAWAAITRKDGFIVNYQGLITAPSLTTAMITSEATGRVLVTREFLTGYTTGATSGMTQSLSFSASTGDLSISDGNTVNLGFTSTNITNWNASYNWGDHSTYGYLTGYTDTNDNIYVTGSTFNTTDGILTFTNVSGGTFNVDLDGRYALSGVTSTPTWEETVIAGNTITSTDLSTNLTINRYANEIDIDLANSGFTNGIYMNAGAGVGKGANFALYSDPNDTSSFFSALAAGGAELKANSGYVSLFAESIYAAESLKRSSELWLDIDDILLRTSNPNNNNAAGLEMVGTSNSVSLYNTKGSSRNRLQIAQPTSGGFTNTILPALNVSATTKYIPLFFTNGTTTVEANSTGLVNITTLLTSGSTSPLTTKGDLYTFDTADQRLPVGAEGYILSSSSGTTTGLEWVPAPSGGTSTWGSITGALSAQTDLQIALNETKATAYKEVPTGTIDGVNTIFTLSHSATSVDFIWVFVNGVGRNEFNYSATTKQIGLEFAPVSGSVIYVQYITQLPGVIQAITNHDSLDGIDSGSIQHITPTQKTNFETAYTHSQSPHAPSDAQKNSDILKNEIEAVLTGSSITSHTHTIEVGIAELKDELKATASATTSVVDWSLGIQFPIPMTGNTTLTFSNIVQTKAIMLVVTGNHVLTLPTGVDSGDWSADFVGTNTNYINIYCVDSATPVFLTTIMSKP